MWVKAIFLIDCCSFFFLLIHSSSIRDTGCSPSAPPSESFSLGRFAPLPINRAPLFLSSEEKHSGKCVSRCHLLVERGIDTAGAQRAEWSTRVWGVMWAAAYFNLQCSIVLTAGCCCGQAWLWTYEAFFYKTSLCLHLNVDKLLQPPFLVAVRKCATSTIFCADDVFVSRYSIAETRWGQEMNFTAAVAWLASEKNC